MWLLACHIATLLAGSALRRHTSPSCVTACTRPFESEATLGSHNRPCSKQHRQVAGPGAAPGVMQGRDPCRVQTCTRHQNLVSCSCHLPVLNIP